MIKSKEQFANATGQTLDNAREVFQTSLESIEKLAKTNLAASKKFLEETSHALKDMTSVSNPKKLFDQVNQLATHTIENNISNCKDVYEIITTTQSKIGKMLEEHMRSTREAITQAFENVSHVTGNAKSHNLGSDTLKSWMNSANQAMENMKKMASDVSAFASNNIKTATDSIKTAATPAKKSTTKK